MAADVMLADPAAHPESAWARWLRALIACDEPSTGGRGRAVISVHGCGQVGAAVAAALAAAEFARLVLVDDGPAPAPLAGHSRAEALCADLVASGHRGVLTGKDRDVAGHHSDLAICLPETAETDRDLTDTLLRADTPHLVTSFVGRTAAVGPLVVPGATPCVRCGDLAAAAADPAWVTQLAARTRRHVRLGPAVHAWVVATVVQQVLAWNAHGRPETLGAALELDTGDWLLRTRPGKVNAACGCRGL